jgi:hypothetical protein
MDSGSGFWVAEWRSVAANWRLPMIETLETIEPYTSYRVAIALVLFGIFVYSVVTTIANAFSLRDFIRDLNRQVNENRLFDDVRLELDPNRDLTALPRLNAKPGRIIKLALLSACLRLVSFRTLWRNGLLILGCAILAPMCAVAYWYVFTL